jgi:hypothetical protein
MLQRGPYRLFLADTLTLHESDQQLGEARVAVKKDFKDRRAQTFRWERVALKKIIHRGKGYIEHCMCERTIRIPNEYHPLS